MNPKKNFCLYLTVAVLAFFLYGTVKYRLGVDFSDEGAYLAFPFRLLFGEKPFSSELITLIRPMDLILILPLKVHPTMTLLEFRLMGWSLHLLSFCALSVCLFRINRAPLLSLLTASVPVFVSNALALGTPSYNTISSDFFLLFACLWVSSSALEIKATLLINGLAGFCLFVATLAYPSLVVIGAIVLVAEFILFFHQEKVRRTLTSMATGFGCSICFIGCWGALVMCLCGSGAAHNGLERLPLILSTSLNSLQKGPLLFCAELLIYIMIFSTFAIVYSIITISLVLVLLILRRKKIDYCVCWILHLFGMLSLAGLVGFYFYERDHLLTFFTLSSLSCGLLYFVETDSPDRRENLRPRFAVFMGIVGSLAYAASTHYFSLYRSWMSGNFALPFCFSLCLFRFIHPREGKSFLRDSLTASFLVVTIAVLALIYYDNIYRDSLPDKLTAGFTTIPKLNHIRSTPERVAAVEGLYGYIKPKLAYGEPVLVYDDCAFLYFVLDARPAYGLARAFRYCISRPTLQALDQEFRAKPLPRFAIRTIVDVSANDWTTAPATSYDDYPLNDTVLANYDLEKTIFPFEVWRLKPGRK